jgi:hypothetical protein
MGKGGRAKIWPRSWKQSAIVGGTVTLKGRSFEKDLVVLPMTVEAESPAHLEERGDEALVIKAGKQRPS